METVIEQKDRIIFQYRTWCGAWNSWTICEQDTYDSMKNIAENDSSIQVRMTKVPYGLNSSESFINWWESLASPFGEGEPRVAANQAWNHSRYVTEKEMLEVVAQGIYDQWRFMPGWEPWVPGGNSLRQVDARKLAKNYAGK